MTASSSPTGKFMSGEVVITMSDTFKSHWSEQDGDVPFLQKIQQVSLLLQNEECISDVITLLNM